MDHLDLVTRYSLSLPFVMGESESGPDPSSRRPTEASQLVSSLPCFFSLQALARVMGLNSITRNDGQEIRGTNSHTLYRLVTTD